jgi:CO/xanthine dehydrogenase Mo-binding subunit
VFVGEPILAVAAETPHIAEDMVDAITIDYEPIEAVTDVDQSLAPGAPTIHQGMADNIVFFREFGGGDADKAFQQADLVLEKIFNFPRQTAVPLEGRGVIASYDRGQDHLTVWTSTRAPHQSRSVFATVMRLPEYGVRVIGPDTGGEFGIKGTGYPEAIILSFLSKKIDRPVKWVEHRMENLLACAHAHEQRVEVSVAAKDDGTVLGIRSKVLVDQGAHCLGPTSAGLEPMTTGPVHRWTLPHRKLPLRGLRRSHQQVPRWPLSGRGHGPRRICDRADYGHDRSGAQHGPGGSARPELHPTS